MKLANTTLSNPFSDLSKYTSRLPCSKCTGILIATSFIALALITYVAKKVVNSDLIQSLFAKTRPDGHSAPSLRLPKQKTPPRVPDEDPIKAIETSVLESLAASTSSAISTRPTEEESELLEKAHSILRTNTQLLISQNSEDFSSDIFSNLTEDQKETLDKALNLTHSLIAEKQQNPTQVSMNLDELRHIKLALSASLGIDPQISPSELVSMITPEVLSNLPIELFSMVNSSRENFAADLERFMANIS